MSRINPELILMTSDLFFASKIQGTAKLCNLILTVIQQLPGEEEFPAQSIFIIDLESAHLHFEALKTFLDSSSLQAIGYAPHVKKELFESGRDAGINQIYSRGQISRDLGTILSNLIHPEA